MTEGGPEVDRERLIDELAGELAPVRRPTAVATSLLLWLGIAWALVVGATLAAGPFREGFAGQMLDSPRFALEVLLGFATALAAMWGALELSVPGSGRPSKLAVPGLALAAAWTLLLAHGLRDSALPPSMLGKREGCHLQAFFFSLPPLVAAFVELRKRLALRRVWAGALVGAAAGAIPALAMQLGCMYDPWHGLTHHLAPALATMAIGALAGARLLPKI